MVIYFNNILKIDKNRQFFYPKLSVYRCIGH